MRTADESRTRAGTGLGDGPPHGRRRIGDDLRRDAGIRGRLRKLYGIEGSRGGPARMGDRERAPGRAGQHRDRYRDQLGRRGKGSAMPRMITKQTVYFVISP